MELGLAAHAGAARFPKKDAIMRQRPPGSTPDRGAAAPGIPCEFLTSGPAIGHRETRPSPVTLQLHKPLSGGPEDGNDQDPEEPADRLAARWFRGGRLRSEQCRIDLESAPVRCLRPRCGRRLAPVSPSAGFESLDPDDGLLRTEYAGRATGPITVPRSGASEKVHCKQRKP